MVTAYVLCKVSSGTAREVCQKLVSFEEVLQSDIIFGEYDVIAKVSCSGLDALEEFLTQKIRNVASIILTSTMIIAREYRGKGERPKAHGNQQPHSSQLYG
jgi:DNA-binding Lrp family transcriptional regulator